MEEAGGFAFARGAPGTEVRAGLASIFSLCRSLREKPALKDELLAAIEAGDEQACVRLLTGQDERARGELYPAVAQKIEEIDSGVKSDFGPSRPQIFRRQTAAHLAMLGTATLGELKKTGPWRFHGEAAGAILTGRRPGWLAEWGEFELEKNFRNWVVVRALVRD